MEQDGTRIVNATVTDDALRVELADGRVVETPLSWYPRLLHGTAAERANFEISNVGWGIHWPDLDEDLGVEGMLLGLKSMESASSFARWLARRGSGGEAPPNRSGAGE